MNLKKLNRTSEELLVRKNEFLKICEILEELKIEFFTNRRTPRCYKRTKFY